MVPLHNGVPRWAAFLVLGGCLMLLYSRNSSIQNQGTRTFPNRTSPKFATSCEDQPELIWDSIETKDVPGLSWVDCYSAYECTRLKVPLNYSDPQGDTAVIALIRIPSSVSSGSPEYLGPILFNPGGPGGSGIDLILRAGRDLMEIVGPQFDVVSFDPRGVGRSTPRVSFFETAAERALWGELEYSPLNTTFDALPRSWARAQLSGLLAEERDHGVLNHINTENTARDMLRITEAHGRENIQYWGFSYGTILGATFAAMFPDRIDRMVIDGVADAENYFATLWSNNLLDTDKTLATFFDGCAAAGPESCAFHAPTAEQISQNLTSLYESVRAHPIPVRTPTSYGLVDYAELRNAIFTAFYKPYALFAPLAQALSDLAAGNGTRLFQLTEQPLFECSCNSPRPYNVIRDGGKAIACTDGKEVQDSPDDLRTFYEEMSKISDWAEIWAGFRIRCSGWPKQRKDHFQGPFVGNTSHPILLVGNTADPVTPLWAAHKTSKGFPGSVVLTQDSPGHCSIAVPSICTQKHIRRYFVDGTLPEVDTLCSVDGELFPSKLRLRDQTSLAVDLTSSDSNLLQALESLSRSFDVSLPLEV